MIKYIRGLYMGINDFKKGYHRRTNKVKDEKDDLVTESHSIVVRRRDHFSQLLNVHRVNDVRRTKLRTTEPLVSWRLRWLLKAETTHSPGTDQIPQEVIKAGARAIHYETHKLINSNSYKEELPE
jgi:hypothetical protein